MIDEKINKTLKELEQGLQDVESARKQVERTVSSFSNLNTTTLEYVSKLGTITTKVQELVGYVGKDYAQKVKDFEKDREAVIKSSNAATEKLSNATEEFKDSLFEIQTKLKYSLMVNAVSLVVIGTIVLLLLK
jgi:methyl-accepting chemotaxis protein